MSEKNICARCKKEIEDRPRLVVYEPLLGYPNYYIICQACLVEFSSLTPKRVFHVVD